MPGDKWISSALWEKLRPVAREMRHEPTLAEAALWQRLRRNQLCGAHFRRQHPLGQFIVDFYCAQACLVIEIDGAIHQYTTEEDAIRQEYLESLGLCVVRFTNEDVLNDSDAVIKRIVEAMNKNPLHPTSSLQSGWGG